MSSLSLSTTRACRDQRSWPLLKGPLKALASLRAGGWWGWRARVSELAAIWRAHEPPMGEDDVCSRSRPIKGEGGPLGASGVKLSARAVPCPEDIGEACPSEVGAKRLAVATGVERSRAVCGDARGQHWMVELGRRSMACQVPGSALSDAHVSHVLVCVDRTPAGGRVHEAGDAWCEVRGRAANGWRLRPLAAASQSDPPACGLRPSDGDQSPPCQSLMHAFASVSCTSKASNRRCMVAGCRLRRRGFEPPSTRYFLAFLYS